MMHQRNQAKSDVSVIEHQTQCILLIHNYDLVAS